MNMPSLLLYYVFYLGFAATPLALLSHPSKQKTRDATMDVSAEVNRPSLTPVAWIHIPKAGTSFINTLIHHPAVCPTMPSNAYVEESQHAFWEAHPKGKFCPGGFSESFQSPPGHHGIGNSYDSNRDHVIAFFREPTKRLYSAFNYGQHGWPLVGKAHNISEFANITKGCQVRMLTRDAKSDSAKATCGGGDVEPVSSKDVQTAINRLQNMSFVGITEEYDLSVCLFHAIFGGTCSDHEFVNTRRRSHEETGLEGFVDEIDAPLYKAATERFWGLMQDHKLDRAACELVCRDATTTKPFALDVQVELLRKPMKDLYRFDWPGRKRYEDDNRY